MISERIGQWVRRYMLHVGQWLARAGMTANMATVVGLLLNAGVAAVIASGHPRIGGVLLLVASAFDMVDGAIARATGTVSRFGGFFDATLDRYSEFVVYLGLLVWLNQTQDDHIGSVLILIAASGALLISYARARAEAVGYSASVGLVARPERVVLLALCLIINQPLWALWALAIATHVTALTRIVHVWRLANAETKTGTTEPSEP
ncbi:MAG TPA: CDP-alcohol phosphatidyltransferase family protein [Thermomicrobiales bacterium]|nr:CDP-alcohol phosphatidyltransferase family protein [Thermomicrobiales bacterium]